MEHYINQTNSELLSLLVDGELEDSQATVLFSELTQNQDLRNELQQHLAIRESVRNDIEAYTTPLTLTQRVFASLGVDSTFINTMPGASVNNINKPFNILKRFGPLAVAVLITSLITTIIVSNVYESRIDSIKSNIPVVSSIEENNNSQIQAGFQSDNDINANNSNRVHNSWQGNNPNKVTVGSIENSQDVNSSSTDETAAVSYENTNTGTKNNTSYLTYINTSSPFIIGNNPTIGNGLNVAAIENEVFNPEIKTNAPRQYSISLRGIAGKTYEGNHYGQQPIATDINAAIGFLVSSGIVENLQFGFEIGREPFHLTQVNIEEFLKDTDKDPNSAIFWGGVIVHYDMPFLAMPAMNFYPWVQQLVGYSEHGAVSKSSIGIQYDIANLLTITLGAEYSLLLYQYNLNWYDTNKLGLTSGVIFKF